MENQVTPACLLKILGTQNKKLLDLVIDILKYQHSEKIIITVQYMPSHLN